MKTILVPTDFSDTARSALNYAVMLAELQHTQVRLLHVFALPVVVSETPFAVLQEEREALKKQALENMKDEWQKTGGKLKCSFSVAEGVPWEAIVHEAEKTGAAMIVMGTTGAGGIGTGIFGSTASKVTAKAGCPVIAVPHGAYTGSRIKMITYATAYHESDLDEITAVCELALAFGCQVNILHIAPNDASADEEVKKMGAFMGKVENATRYNNLSFQIRHADNAAESLEEYLANHGADLLVMSTHRHGLLARLFTQSDTKELVLHSNVPVMVFHHAAESAVRLYA